MQRELSTYLVDGARRQANCSALQSSQAASLSKLQTLKSAGMLCQHKPFCSFQGSSRTGSKAGQQELGCSIFVSPACLINIQHMAQAAFRLLFPDSGTSCVSQRLAHLLPLIPASPQHMANYILNSSLNFCVQTTFFSLLQRSRVILYSPKQHHVHTDHHPLFSQTHSDVAVPSCKQVHQTPLHSHPLHSFPPRLPYGASAAHEAHVEASNFSFLQTHGNGVQAQLKERRIPMLNTLMPHYEQGRYCFPMHFCSSVVHRKSPRSKPTRSSRYACPDIHQPVKAAEL